MRAGTAKVDITPKTNIWMDGMVRTHKSLGIHDPLFARALVLANNNNGNDAFVVVSADICGLGEKDTFFLRQATSSKTGIPETRIIIASTHTHSGPATIGLFNPIEREYVEELLGKIVVLIEKSFSKMKPVAVGWGSGREDTISHYRRLLTRDGHVVMNWEPYPAESLSGPLGVIDPEVGMLKIVDEKDSEKVNCILFNHSGHPNVMSGENYFLSADYPGVAQRLLENEFGEMAIFLNGAEGTMDIDGLRDRDWQGVERAGRALARVVSKTTRTISPCKTAIIRGAHIKYTIPSRKITDEELTWAEEVLKRAERTTYSLPDGVGDDYKALLYKRLRENEGSRISVEQICFAVNEGAFISFPGELFTEIGMHIKAKSPFPQTYIIGLANGCVGYIPTGQAIGEGGYAVDTRRVDAEAEDIIVEQSLALLKEVHRLQEEKGVEDVR